jgi:DNA-binding IscR family transcriptional regulator
VDHAIRVMIHLAGLPPETRASRSELAIAAKCPEQFLSKVLQNAARSRGSYGMEPRKML